MNVTVFLDMKAEFVVRTSDGLEATFIFESLKPSMVIEFNDLIKMKDTYSWYLAYLSMRSGSNSARYGSS